MVIISMKSELPADTVEDHKDDGMTPCSSFISIETNSRGEGESLLLMSKMRLPGL